MQIELSNRHFFAEPVPLLFVGLLVDDTTKYQRIVQVFCRSRNSAMRVSACRRLLCAWSTLDLYASVTAMRG